MKIDEEDFQLAQQIHDLLIETGDKVSTAESCTCGRIVSTIASVPEASEYVEGGLAAYQNKVKHNLLNVPYGMIKKYDVVSEQVVTQMVIGACELFGTKYAIASTGYAGRGHDDLPQGTIWIGWGTKNDVHTLLLTENLYKERNTINAAKQAIKGFIKYLENKSNKTKLHI